MSGLNHQCIPFIEPFLCEIIFCPEFLSFDFKSNSISYYLHKTLLTLLGNCLSSVCV